MTCAVCGASTDKNQAHCSICGWGQTPEHEDDWSRQAESEMYEDLRQALEPGKTLLAATRGRVAGAVRTRLSLNPHVMLSPYVNLGLTSEEILIQRIHPATGRAASDKASAIPIADVAAILWSDADQIEPGRTVRLAVRLAAGHEMRLRASGRLAVAARKLAEVWTSLTAGRVQTQSSAQQCTACSKPLDRPYRFCP